MFPVPGFESVHAEIVYEGEGALKSYRTFLYCLPAIRLNIPQCNK